MDLRKITSTVEFTVATILAALFLRGVFFLSNMFNWEARIPQHDLVLSFAAVALLIGTFMFLNKTPKYDQFFSEVVDELSRVTWPNNLEVRGATILCSIFIIIAGIIWGTFDLGVNRVIALIVSI